MAAGGNGGAPALGSSADVLAKLNPGGSSDPIGVVYLQRVSRADVGVGALFYGSAMSTINDLLDTLRRVGWDMKNVGRCKLHHLLALDGIQLKVQYVHAIRFLNGADVSRALKMVLFHEGKFGNWLYAEGEDWADDYVFLSMSELGFPQVAAGYLRGNGSAGRDLRQRLQWAEFERAVRKKVGERLKEERLAVVLPVLKQMFFDSSGSIRAGMNHEGAVLVEKDPNARGKEAGAPFDDFMEQAMKVLREMKHDFDVDCAIVEHGPESDLVMAINESF